MMIGSKANVINRMPISAQEHILKLNVVSDFVYHLDTVAGAFDGERSLWFTKVILTIYNQQTRCTILFILTTICKIISLWL